MDWFCTVKGTALRYIEAPDIHDAYRRHAAACGVAPGSVQLLPAIVSDGFPNADAEGCIPWTRNPTPDADTLDAHRFRKLADTHCWATPDGKFRPFEWFPQVGQEIPETFDSLEELADAMLEGRTLEAPKACETCGHTEHGSVYGFRSEAGVLFACNGSRVWASK